MKTEKGTQSEFFIFYLRKKSRIFSHETSSKEENFTGTKKRLTTFTDFYSLCEYYLLCQLFCLFSGFSSPFLSEKSRSQEKRRVNSRSEYQEEKLYYRVLIFYPHLSSLLLCILRNRRKLQKPNPLTYNIKTTVLLLFSSDTILVTRLQGSGFLSIVPILKNNFTLFSLLFFSDRKKERKKLKKECWSWNLKY